MNLRELRDARGLSQDQLADMAGISTRTLQRAEASGQASPETWKCLAAALEVDFTALRNPPPAAPREAPGDTPAPDEAARDIAELKQHAWQFVLTVIGLTVINLLLTPDKLWVLWVILGWGVGLVTHAASVFLPPSPLPTLLRRDR